MDSSVLAIPHGVPILLALLLGACRCKRWFRRLSVQDPGGGRGGRGWDRSAGEESHDHVRRVVRTACICCSATKLVAVTSTGAAAGNSMAAATVNAAALAVCDETGAMQTRASAAAGRSASSTPPAAASLVGPLHGPFVIALLARVGDEPASHSGGPAVRSWRTRRRSRSASGCEPAGPIDDRAQRWRRGV